MSKGDKKVVPSFEGLLKKQGTRVKSWSQRRCVVADKTLTYSHRFGGSQAIALTQDTFIHLDGTDVHITASGEPAANVFRAPTRRLAMQVKAALLQEIGWQKRKEQHSKQQRNGSSKTKGLDRQFHHKRHLQLCHAAAEGATDTISELAPTPELVNSTISGSTPLHWACFEGKIECVKQLLKLGASLEVEDRAGLIPAETCIFLGKWNKRNILTLLAQEHRNAGLGQNCAARVYAELVYKLNKRFEGVTHANLERIVVDFTIGRHDIEAHRASGDGEIY